MRAGKTNHLRAELTISPIRVKASPDNGAPMRGHLAAFLAKVGAGPHAGGLPVRPRSGKSTAKATAKTTGKTV